MKKLIFIIAICLIPTLLWAGSVENVISVIARKNVASAGGTDYTSDANCQGAWLFSDDLTDESGEGNTLTAASNATYTADYPSNLSSPTGKALNLNGTTDYFNRVCANVSANFPSKAQKTDMAVCAWTQPDTVGDLEGVVYIGSFAYQKDWNELKFYAQDGVDSSAPNLAAVTISANDYSHVCVSFDGTTTTATWWVSTDGGGFASLSDGGTTTLTNVDYIGGWCGTSLSIGSHQNTGSQYFDGDIYQPIVFDREITRAEALSIYTYGIDGASNN